MGSGEVSTLVRAGYGFAGVPGYLVSTILGFFMTPFLLQVAHLSPFFVGVLEAAAAFGTALLNPCIGYWSDRTPSPRRVSWVLGACIPLSYTYFLFWLVPFETGLWAELYYTIVYVALALSFACYVVPYSALCAELSADYDERTSLATWRWILSLVCGTVGAVGWALILYEDGIRVNDSARGYAVGGLTMAILLLIPPVVLGLTVKERGLISEVTVARASFGSFFSGLRSTFFRKSFIYIVVINTLSWLALTFLTNNLVLYLAYVIEEHSAFPVVLGLVLGVCSLTMPLWAIVGKRYGKRLMYVVGSIIVLVSLIPATFLWNHALYAMFGVSITGGLGLGVLYLGPYSMVPDVVEEDELATGERREGLFFSIFIFFERLAVGIGSLVSGIVLGMAGYNTDGSSDGSGQSTQDPAVVWTLRVLVGVIPPLLLAISWVAVYAYPITRARHAATLARLEQKRKALDVSVQYTPEPKYDDDDEEQRLLSSGQLY